MAETSLLNRVFGKHPRCGDEHEKNDDIIFHSMSTVDVISSESGHPLDCGIWAGRPIEDQLMFVGTRPLKGMGFQLTSKKLRLRILVSCRFEMMED